MIVGMLMVVVIWGGLIALVAWIVVRLSRPKEQSLSPTPLEIARVRYLCTR